MRVIAIVLEAALLLGIVIVVARWRAQTLRAARDARTLTEQIRRDHRLLAGSASPPPGGRHAVTLLGPQDALDLLLVTRYVLDRVATYSALGCAAARARTIGETAAADLGIASHLRRQEGSR